MDFADHIMKLKEDEMWDKYLLFPRESKKKTMEQECDGDTNSNRWARYSHIRIGTGIGRIRNKNMRGHYPKRQHS